MTKDYKATRHTSKHRQYRKKSSRVLWAATLITVALLAGGLYYLGKPQTHTQLKHKLKHSKQIAKHHKQHKPKFEFYQILTEKNQTPHTNDKTPIISKTNTPPANDATLKQLNHLATGNHSSVSSPLPQSPLHSKTQESKKPAISTETDQSIRQEKRYVLQVAAFPRHQEADHLKAKLILEGYPANIETMHQGSTIWYRVKIGPYPKLTIAKKAQQDLQTQQRLAVIIRQANA